MFLRFWWDLAVDVPRYSLRRPQLVLRDLRRYLLLFDSTRFQLVEGQQSYERQGYGGAGRDQAGAAAAALGWHCWRSIDGGSLCNWTGG